MAALVDGSLACTSVFVCVLIDVWLSAVAASLVCRWVMMASVFVRLCCWAVERLFEFGPTVSNPGALVSLRSSCLAKCSAIIVLIRVAFAKTGPHLETAVGKAAL